MMGVDTGISTADAWDDDLDDRMGVDSGIAAATEWDEDDLDDLDAMMGVSTETDGGGLEPAATATNAEGTYFPYAASYEANVAIMNGIWNALLQKEDAGDGEIGQYVLQTIDTAYASLYEAEAFAEEVFEGA
jgi:hypothetical protein